MPARAPKGLPEVSYQACYATSRHHDRFEARGGQQHTQLGEPTPRAIRLHGIVKAQVTQAVTVAGDDWVFMISFGAA